MLSTKDQTTIADTYKRLRAEGKSYLAPGIPRNLRQALAHLFEFRCKFTSAMREHSAGFTMDAQGNAVRPSKGFAVGVHGYSDVDALIVDNIATLIAGEYSSRNFGYWTNPDGKGEIDAVEIIESRHVAIDAARRWGQKAVYSFATGLDVYVADAPSDAPAWYSADGFTAGDRLRALDVIHSAHAESDKRARERRATLNNPKGARPDDVLRALAIVNSGQGARAYRRKSKPSAWRKALSRIARTLGSIRTGKPGTA